MTHPCFRVVRLDLPLDASTFDGMLGGHGSIALEVRPVCDDAAT